MEKSSACTWEACGSAMLGRSGDGYAVERGGGDVYDDDHGGDLS